jgi:uncharacterized protein YbaR (Trm112 family)
MRIPDELLKILRCPASREPLRLSDDGNWLICDASRLRYPIVDGIPRLIASAAEKFEEPTK